MHAGELKQQLAVATAEAAEHKEKAIQASTLVDNLHTQVSFSPGTAAFLTACQRCTVDSVVTIPRQSRITDDLQSDLTAVHCNITCFSGLIAIELFSTLILKFHTHWCVSGLHFAE